MIKIKPKIIKMTILYNVFCLPIQFHVKPAAPSLIYLLTLSSTHSSLH